MPTQVKACFLLHLAGNLIADSTRIELQLIMADCRNFETLDSQAKSTTVMFWVTFGLHKVPESVQVLKPVLTLDSISPSFDCSQLTRFNSKLAEGLLANSVLLQRQQTVKEAFSTISSSHPASKKTSAELNTDDLY